MAGNISRIQDNLTLSESVDYTYDALDRLKTVSGTPGEIYDYNSTTGVLSSKTMGSVGQTYSYDVQSSSACQGGGTRSIAHAVSSFSGTTYGYDCNGNMITRGTLNLSYDTENRLTGVSGSATASFVYDGDGKRVKGVENGVTTVYIGNYYEWSSSGSTSYYYAGAQRIAMRRANYSTNNGLFWLLSDHLGSTREVLNSSGTAVSQSAKYSAWGVKSGTLSLTSFAYTGQRESSYINLVWMNSRWYDPALGRWTQPDTIVPLAAQGVQAWDRYAFVNNNPIRWNDPSGHMVDDGCKTEECNLTEMEINENAQRLAILQAQSYQRQCDAGKEYYCAPAWEAMPEAIGVQAGGGIAFSMPLRGGLFRNLEYQAQVEIGLVLNLQNMQLSAYITGYSGGWVGSPHVVAVGHYYGVSTYQNVTNNENLDGAGISRSASLTADYGLYKGGGYSHGESDLIDAGSGKKIYSDQLNIVGGGNEIINFIDVGYSKLRSFTKTWTIFGGR